MKTLVIILTVAVVGYLLYLVYEKYKTTPTTPVVNTTKTDIQNDAINGIREQLPINRTTLSSSFRVSPLDYNPTLYYIDQFGNYVLMDSNWYYNPNLYYIDYNGFYRRRIRRMPIYLPMNNAITSTQF